MKVKSESQVAQSCPTLCDPMDCSLPGSSIHGISQARVLEWGAIAFSVPVSNTSNYFGGFRHSKALTGQPLGNFFQKKESLALFCLLTISLDGILSPGLLIISALPLAMLIAQLCPSLCNPMDCSPPGSSIHGTLQASSLLESLKLNQSEFHQKLGLNQKL